jgi:phospholipase/carboxylesterase
MRQDRLGRLHVRLTGGTDGRGGGNGPVVILLHGFGAPGDDLVALWQTLDAPPDTRFVFPVGPLSLQMGDGESRAWWMIDLEKLQRDRAAGRSRDLSHEVPKGLVEARGEVLALLEDVNRRLGADPRRTVLGGFSQGAMLACDVTLRTDRPFAGLVLLSGTLLVKHEWAPLMPKRRGLRVLQSHGSDDPLLPFAQAEQLRDLLSQAGLAVDWIGFRGGHEIPPVVLARLGAFLRQTLGPPAR